MARRRDEGQREERAHDAPVAERERALVLVGEGRVLREGAGMSAMGEGKGGRRERTWYTVFSMCMARRAMVEGAERARSERVEGAVRARRDAERGRRESDMVEIVWGVQTTVRRVREEAVGAVMVWVFKTDVRWESSCAESGLLYRRLDAKGPASAPAK